MKRLFKILSVVMILVVLLIPTAVFADDYYDDNDVEYSEESDYYNRFNTELAEYYIKAYDVNINVNEDNSLNVTEKITAHFNVERHGIYRTIPVKNEVTHTDGSSRTVRARIKNIKSSERYDVEKDLDYCTIKIGSENKTVTGDKEYSISYDYLLGQDKNSGFDELYYNIIGDSWDTFINKVTFSITMPKDFDSSKIGFSSGSYGEEGTNILKYNINGKTITGQTVSPLDSNEALTIRLELPDKYFYFDQAAYNRDLSLMIITPLIALALVVFLWAKFGKDKKLVKTIEFYPPDNMTSTEMAYWRNGVVNDDDVTPLLIELANEGYVEICQAEGTSRYFDDGDYQIKKLKPVYTKSDSSKKEFFKGLFASGKNVVGSDDLENEFYVTTDLIKNNFNTFECRYKVFSQKSIYMRMCGWLASILSAVAVVLLCINLADSKVKFIFAAIGLAVSIASFAISFFIRKRTDEGHKKLERIEGFKMFLETAEKEKLEALVNDNPEYFYNILPYTYVLGVSDTWIKKFENINIRPCTWYYSSSPYDYVVFSRFMNQTMTSANAAMTSTPHSDVSGAGFTGGGGGFSGGGSGGGGGGSW